MLYQIIVEREGKRKKIYKDATSASMAEKLVDKNDVIIDISRYDKYGSILGAIER
jgi:hypothetical protein